jgi:hypothetical protein
MKVTTQNAKLNALLETANEAYNDAPKSSSRPRTPKMVLFMGEADRFIAATDDLSKREKIGVMQDLAKLSRTGEVAVTPNAASVLRDYAKALGAPVRLYAARLEY